VVNPVLVALDLPTLEEAELLARTLRDHVGGFKVGLELLMSEGPDVVSRIADLGLPVFADAKLHDIPITVENAANALASRGARWVTAHVGGGIRMLAAAVAGLNSGSVSGKTGLLGVTVLTSLDEGDLEALGVTRSVQAQTLELARLAQSSGAEGVICSPLEVSSIKSIAPGLKVVTPGIRLEGSGTDDQKRTSTPIEALEAGADMIVVGRAITGAVDPAAAASSIVEMLRSAALLRH
jgi:orotidine-5'-phosphate decarboxylase